MQREEKMYNNCIFDIQEVIVVAAETERSSHKVYEKDKLETSGLRMKSWQLLPPGDN